MESERGPVSSLVAGPVFISCLSKGKVLFLQR